MQGNNLRPVGCNTVSSCNTKSVAHPCSASPTLQRIALLTFANVAEKNTRVIHAQEDFLLEFWPIISGNDARTPMKA